MSQLRNILGLIWAHKFKYLVALVACLVFFPLLFPYSDVGDLVSAHIAKMTNNQLFVQFDRLKLALFPTSVGVDNLTVETPRFPALNAQEVEVRPSIGALITQKPEGTLIARGLFHGDVTVELKPGKKTDAGVQTQFLSVKAESLSLAEIDKVAELPILLKGKLKINSAGVADPTFQEQPDFDLDLQVDHLEIPASTVETQMGPMNLPELKLSTVELKGRLSGGRLNIERGVIGKPTDELSGTIKGGISLLLQNRGGVVPVPGAYNFEIDLTTKKSFEDKASLFLGFLESYKSPLGDGARYQFKVSATSPQMPPNINAMH